MDALSNFKGRIGEAFVEEVLRQARYKVGRLGRESQLQRMFKTGRSEFLPDFLVWKAVDASSDGVPLHRLLCVEVKYRASIRDYLRRFGAELLSHVGEQWPELYVIFVTDHPDEGRSCFQLLHLRASDRASPLETIDLHTVPALGIDKAITDEYEKLVRQVFSLLQAKDDPRKPLAKAPSGNGVSVETRPAEEFRAWPS